MHVFADNAESTLASAILSTDVSLPFAAGTGAIFPDVSATGHIATLTLEKADGSAREIVKLTDRASDTGTIVRGREGTAAIAFSTGDKISLRETAGSIDRFSRNPFIDRQVGVILPSLATTTLNALGISLGTVAGTWSTYANSVNGTVADEHRAQLVTSTGLTNTDRCGFNTDVGHLFFRSTTAQHGGFFAKLRFVPPTIVAGNRLFIGFNSSGTIAAANGNVDPSLTGSDMFGIGLDAGDTNITIYSRTASGATTKTALSTPVSGANMSGRMYDFEFECLPGAVTSMRVKVTQWAGDVRSILHDGSVGATLPTANVGMRLHFGLGQGTDTAVARALRFCRAFVEFSSSPSF